MGPWTAFEIWYKVLDKNTLLEINSFPIHYTSEIDKANYEQTKKKTKIYPTIYIQTTIIPSSDCWIKKENWFWCNAQDWQKYLDHLKSK